MESPIEVISLSASLVCCDKHKISTLAQVLPHIKLKPLSVIYFMYPNRSQVPKKTRLFIDYIEQSDFYILYLLQKNRK